MLDPYYRSLRFVTTRLVDSDPGDLNEATVIDLIRSGSCYFAFEQIADPQGFSFHAENSEGLHPMGSTVGVESKLVLQSPIPAKFRIFFSGSLFRELEGQRFEVGDLDTGFYRVEVFPLNPPSLIEGKPWIVSNPIYVR